MSGDSGYESERNFGDSTLSLGNAIAASTATTPLTTSAGLRHHTMLRHRKYANVQSERIATISACKHHTVDSHLCQRRVFQTESTTMGGGRLHHVRATDLLHIQILPI